jgi:hypothetical protein
VWRSGVFGVGLAEEDAAVGYGICGGTANGAAPEPGEAGLGLEDGFLLVVDVEEIERRGIRG